MLRLDQSWAGFKLSIPCCIRLMLVVMFSTCAVLTDTTLPWCVQATRGIEATDRLFRDMEAVVVKSLKAVQGIMMNDK
jgi:hypothetical protein